MLPVLQGKNLFFSPFVRAPNHLLFLQAEEHFGGLLDILVNNVGTNIRKATVDYSPEELAYIMNTNFTSLFLLTKVNRGRR